MSAVETALPTLTLRAMTDEEEKEAEEQAAEWCTYIAATPYAPLGINVGDDFCVRPCPPCPDITRVQIVNPRGAVICTLAVLRLAAGHCSACPPGGHRFTWA